MWVPQGMDGRYPTLRPSAALSPNDRGPQVSNWSAATALDRRSRRDVLPLK